MLRSLVASVVVASASCGGTAAPPPVPPPPAAPVAVVSASPPPAAVPTCFADQRVENGVCVAGSCPVGSSLRGTSCLATADVTCPPGMRFDRDDACVAAQDPPDFEPSYRAAMGAFRAWRGAGEKLEGGAEARGRAFAALAAFHEKHAADAKARVYLVEVTYRTAYLLRVAEEKGADVWTRKSAEAFEALRAASKESLLGTRPSELAAETALAVVDAEAWSTFDYETGHLRYGDRAPIVTRQIEEALGAAEKLMKKLEPLTKVETYGSPRVAAEALARQASLWDGVRTSIQRIRAERPDTDALRRIRERESLVGHVIHGYGEAVALATRFGVTTPPVQRAWRRLGELETEVGEDKLRAGLADVGRLRYTKGMFAAPLTGSQ